MWRSAVGRLCSPSWHADGVLHSPDPAGGSGGESHGPRQTKTELQRELAEHRQTEEALARRTAELEDARNFLDSVLEHLPVMLFVKDAEHLRFVRWNKTEEEALGIERSVAIGKSDYDFFPEEQARFFEAKDRAVLTGGEMVDIPEEAIQTAHRGLRFLHTIKVPVSAPTASRSTWSGSRKTSRTGSGPRRSWRGPANRRPRSDSGSSRPCSSSSRRRIFPACVRQP